MKKRDLQRFQKMLLLQKEQLLGNARKALSGDIHLDPDDFPDEIDTASSEIGLSFIGRLRERARGL
ncbi:MAG TPA: conjugal transfer protein TraR, partial [Myxococcota bacterium]|nr:conjugal transfer protein TraR [Myxococcota bacterium]